MRRHTQPEPSRRVESGKKLLVSKLAEVQKDIFQLEKQLKEKFNRRTVHRLKQLVNSYNEALVVIFGRKNARRLLNYKLENNSIISFIPEGEYQIKRYPLRKKRSRSQFKGNEDEFGELGMLDESLLADGYGYDSEEIAYRLKAEDAAINSDDPELELYYSDEIPKGTGYFIVTDILTQKQYRVPFRLDGSELEFVKLTIELFLSNGSPVLVVINKTDFELGLFGPQNNKSALN